MGFRALILIFAAACAAQEPQQPAPKPFFENTGKPIPLPFTCGEELMRAFGLTCTVEHPCPVYLELAAVEAVGDRIFAGGNFHTESATLESVMLASDDGGMTWHEAHERVCGAGFDRIEFFDLENGWAAGQTLGAIPRDPFFLLTKDGGKTWRARPVSEESRAGAIESFRFDSATHGVVWIDRGRAAGEGSRWEVYETTTGGDVWTLREATERAPSNVGRGRMPEAWRVVADGRSRSYRVEKQAAAGRWQPVAAFLIRAGECRQADVPLPPPPEDSPAAAPKPEPKQ